MTSCTADIDRTVKRFGYTLAVVLAAILIFATGGCSSHSERFGGYHPRPVSDIPANPPPVIYGTDTGSRTNCSGGPECEARR